MDRRASLGDPLTWLLVVVNAGVLAAFLWVPFIRDLAWTYVQSATPIGALLLLAPIVVAATFRTSMAARVLPLPALLLLGAAWGLVAGAAAALPLFGVVLFQVGPGPGVVLTLLLAAFVTMGLGVVVGATCGAADGLIARAATRGRGEAGA